MTILRTYWTSDTRLYSLIFFILLQDTTMTSYNEGPDIDEEGMQVQDQDNEAEIMDGKNFSFYTMLLSYDHN